MLGLRRGAVVGGRGDEGDTGHHGGGANGFESELGDHAGLL
jgi:hypothetical protein